MERVHEILSIQNLSSMDHANQIHFNQQYFNQQLGLHIQQQLQQQQHLQHHQRQQQQQQQLQQHPFQQPRQHNQQPHLSQNQLLRHPRNLMITSNGHNNTIQNGIQNGLHPPPKKELIDLLTCKLCRGYLIDATTLDLCMHTFCKPCVVKHLKDHLSCPECHMEIKDKRYLNRLKPDTTIQNIVYKLVPGLYEKEMARRRRFYSDRPSSTPRYKSEMFGDIPPSKTIRPDDMLNVGLTWLNFHEEIIRTYFYLRADSTMQVLKKLIIGKFGLDMPIKFYYGNSEVFFDLTTLKDIAATYNWDPESKILNLSFKEVENKDSQTSSSPQMNSAPVPLNGPSGSPC